VIALFGIDFEFFSISILKMAPNGKPIQLGVIGLQQNKKNKVLCCNSKFL